MEQRRLPDNKGIVVTIPYNGNSHSEIVYETSTGKVGVLKFDWNVKKDTEIGTLFYAHIDDEYNELLVLSDSQFPY
jgi:hypothetical protein